MTCIFSGGSCVLVDQAAQDGFSQDLSGAEAFRGDAGLLIRGFGVQGPGGAPGLTWGLITLVIFYVSVLSPCLLGVCSRARTLQSGACQNGPSGANARPRARLDQWSRPSGRVPITPAESPIPMLSRSVKPTGNRHSHGGHIAGADVPDRLVACQGCARQRQGTSGGGADRGRRLRRQVRWPRRVDNTLGEQRWQAFCRAAAEASFGSCLVLSLRTDRLPAGAVALYGEDPNVFRGAAHDIALLFAAQGGTAVRNAALYRACRRMVNNLHAGLESRAVIEQAKGILHAQLGVPPGRSLPPAEPLLAKYQPAGQGDRGTAGPGTDGRQGIPAALAPRGLTTGSLAPAAAARPLDFTELS